MDALPRAVALLSGGMDSAVAAAKTTADGFAVHALSIDYGQRQHAELEAAERIVAALGLAGARRVRVDLAALGGSALTDPDVPVPKDRADVDIGRGVPVTYVPARNTVFLAVAVAAAEALEADAVVIGVNALDSSGYPDCRPAFLDAFRAVMAVGTRRGTEGRPVRLLAPLLHFSKGDIVRLGTALDVPFEHTLSCYDPVEDAPSARWLACGRCDACRLRARGFAEAGREDPAPRVDAGRGRGS